MLDGFVPSPDESGEKRRQLGVGLSLCLFGEDADRGQDRAFGGLADRCIGLVGGSAQRPRDCSGVDPLRLTEDGDDAADDLGQDHP